MDRFSISARVSQIRSQTLKIHILVISVRDLQIVERRPKKRRLEFRGLLNFCILGQTMEAFGQNGSKSSEERSKTKFQMLPHARFFSSAPTPRQSARPSFVRILLVQFDALIVLHQFGVRK